MATCAGSPQAVIRVRGSNKCSKNHGQEVVFYCQNCDKLSCANCATQECQGHKFERISNVIPNATQKLQDFITQAELTEIPSFQGKLQAADNDFAQTKNNFKNQISKIRKQNEALKKQLDKITETFVKTCQDIEQQNFNQLQNYKRDLQTRIDKLASQIKDVKGSLRSGNDILVFDMSHVIQSESDDLPKPVYSSPEFTPETFSVQLLEQLYGRLNIQKQSFSLSGNMKVKSKFKPYAGHWIKSIHATAGDQAWLSFVDTNTNSTVEKILLTDQSGQVKQTLDMDVRVTDFCVSPHSGDFWYCSGQDNSVREVKTGQSTVRFTTDNVPYYICVTKDDHVVIGQDRQVIKYTKDGQVICRTSGGIPPAVRTPRHLSECQLTSNIAVVDLNAKEDGGNDKSCVNIFNHQLQPLYTYTGEGQQSPTKPFVSYDVCFTVAGELVIADFNNKAVVLLTGTGRYLTSLYTNKKSQPVAVCVHSGVVWVSFYNGSVKVLGNI